MGLISRVSSRTYRFESPSLLKRINLIKSPPKNYKNVRHTQSYRQKRRHVRRHATRSHRRGHPSRRKTQRRKGHRRLYQKRIRQEIYSYVALHRWTKLWFLCTHETKHFIYFYLGQVAVLLFKFG